MRLHPRAAVVVHDLAMVWVAWMLAHLVRYSIWPDAPAFAPWSWQLVAVLATQAVVFFATGLYRGLWRFASLPDLINILRAAIAGTVLLSLVLFLVDRLEGVPRSVFIFYPLILAVLLATPRLAYRFWKDRAFSLPSASRQRVLIIGAGRSGETLARDLRRDEDYLPIGFLDDSPRLRSALIHGLPVFGTVDDLQRVIDRHAIDLVIIAIPTATSEQMQRIVTRLEVLDVEFRTLPRMQDIVEGRAAAGEIKEVAIEDLLGRDPVALDWEGIRSGLTGQRVMVTGAGGSIGAELCRQIARLQPARLSLLELSEHALYQIERELRASYPELVIDPVLGDAGDAAAVDSALNRLQPQVIFHAAAFKHVPLLERQVREAVRNNLFATQCMATAAIRHGVSTFVLISTDKAVQPSSIMGATKRMAEAVCQLSGGGDTKFITVRFGNVLNSAGSVVPLFREQLRRGGPLTVTHPEMTRYFMTIAEACQLIMQAAIMGEGGELYVLDMGKPVSIKYLAEQMIQLAGKEPGKDIDIHYTGLRAGEKLFERLFAVDEPHERTAHPKILSVCAQSRPEVKKLLEGIEQARQAVEQCDEALLRDWLRTRLSTDTARDNIVEWPRRA